MSDLEIAGAGPVKICRKGWLLLFGALEILIGVGAALLGLLVMVVFLFAERFPAARIPPSSNLAMAFMACFYGAAALFFLAAGIGTLRSRRWARIAMLVVSSLWLALGVMSIAVLLLLWPMLSRSISGTGHADSGGAVLFALALIGATLLSLYVLLPACFLIFYTRKSVKAAFARGEVGEAVTHRHPLPLLALCVWIAIAALSTLIGLTVNAQVVFSIILTGAPAFAVTLALAGVQGWLARGLYRLERRAWWGTLAFYLLMGISGFVTLYRIPMTVLVERMGFDVAGQPAAAEEMTRVIQSFIPALALVGNLLFLSLVLYVGKYFRAQGPASEFPLKGDPAADRSLPSA